MRKTIITAAILTIAVSPSFASLQDMVKKNLANDALSRRELTSKLTRLRDIGGTTPNRSIACISYDKYDQYLQASAGDENFYPTPDECWRTEYNQEVKATGSCSGATTRNMFNPDLVSVVLVCEFNTGGWLGKDVWIEVGDVEPK